MRRLAIGIVIGLLLALILQAVCARPLPEPGHAASDSLERVHTRDSAVIAEAFHVARDTATARADAAERSHQSAARLRIRVDTLFLTDTVMAFDTLRVAYDSLERARARTFDAYRGAVETASRAYTGWMDAEGQLNQERAAWGEERDAWRATLHRAQRRKSWAAGLLADERLSPAGAWVARDVGPVTLSAQVLREAGESRGYLGAGIRF